MSPKKYYGQHFLYQPYFFETIAKALEIQPEDRILEIGTGPARLTETLLKAGAKLHGVEIDREMEEPLSRLQSQYPNFTYAIQDFLTLSKDSLCEINKIVGNLPYHLTIPILEKVIFEMDVNRAVFLLAEATALRFLAKEGSREYSSITVMVQSYFTIHKLLRIDRKSFFPPPKIDSILVKLDKRRSNEILTPNEFQLIKHLFSQRRKMIINSFPIDSGSKEKWTLKLEKLSINPQERIENLSVKTLHHLVRAMVNNEPDPM
jgi:16S rRNA (adenine1518-N6/adenine1519-N6)-dimethyltransferase